MSKGTPALIAWLAVVTVAMIVLYALAILALQVAARGESTSVIRLFWAGLMRAMDAGNVAGDEGSWPFLLVNLAVTFGGIFVFSALIGVLNTGLEARLDDLRKGRSKVIEEGHVLVLGWSPAVFTILSELVQANENKKDACVVILADHDKIEMEDAIRERVGELRTTRVVCRNGSPTDMTELDVVSVQTTKSVLVLSPSHDEPDIDVIKTLLAITNAPNRRKQPYHVVAEIQDERNRTVAKMVARDEVEVVLAGDLISRITVQTCRQSGLSVVHTELLDFAGDEIYFADALGVAGQTFGDVLFAYRTSSVIGLVDQDGVRVLPELDRRVDPEDRIIAISADDDTIVVTAERTPVDESAITALPDDPARPERTIVIGWNRRGPAIVRGLDAYVSEGSDVFVVAESDHADEIAAIGSTLTKMKASFRRADTTDRGVLDSLAVPEFDHVIVLGNEGIDAQRSDARVLVTLLHLREIGEIARLDLAIVSEMRDVRNRALAEVTHADDFIVSDKLVSLMMCQIAENKRLNAVLSELFDPDGAEIYIKPAPRFVKPGVPVTYATVVEAARRRGEIAIGYRLAADSKNAARQYGVRVNPDKASMVTLGPSDMVIVVAES